MYVLQAINSLCFEAMLQRVALEEDANVENNIEYHEIEEVTF